MLEQFDTWISQYAAEFGVPKNWVQAVIMGESSGDPRASNPRDPSYGLMGIMPATARGLGYTGPVEGLYDAATNIRLGSKLLGQLRRSYGDDLRRVYSAYNSGDPDLYLSSSQVAANVNRVIEWASKFAGVGVGLIGVAALAGLWWWSNRKR